MGSLLKHLDYRLTLPAIARFPPAVAYRLADIRGALIWSQRADSRRHAQENISRVLTSFSTKQVRKIARQPFLVESRNEMEAFWYNRNLNFLESVVRVSGFEVLKEAYEAGQGVLLFSGHIGSTGLFFAVMGKKGIKMNIIGRSIDPGENPLHPAALRYNKKRVCWIEEAVGNPFLLTGRGNYPVLREKLDRGEVLLMLIDVVPLFVRRTLTVTFFRRPAAFPYGIAGLYRQTRARLLQWTIHRNDKVGRQEIEIQDVTERVDRSMNETEILQQLVGLLEEKIRLHPGHWLLWDSLEHFYTTVQASNSRAPSLLTVE